MGLQDVFFQMRLLFDSRRSTQNLREDSGRDLLRGAGCFMRSCQLNGQAHPAFAETRAAKGDLQFDLWGVTPEDTDRWDALREKMKEHGLRNSLMIAIAPTATIASIAGCYECIEPQVSNLFKRETLVGDFVQINKYLVQELKALGLWTDEIRNKIKLSEGLGSGDRRIRRRIESDLPHGVGNSDAFADRHDGRPRCIHRPERLRSTCLWKARSSASFRRCTCTHGRKA